MEEQNAEDFASDTLRQNLESLRINLPHGLEIMCRKKCFMAQNYTEINNFNEMLKEEVGRISTGQEPHDLEALVGALKDLRETILGICRECPRHQEWEKKASLETNPKPETNKRREKGIRGFIVEKINEGYRVRRRKGRGNAYKIRADTEWQNNQLSVHFQIEGHRARFTIDENGNVYVQPHGKEEPDDLSNMAQEKRAETALLISWIYNKMKENNPELVSNRSDDAVVFFSADTQESNPNLTYKSESH